MRYAVIIRRTATGFSVDVPDVPGCVATAASLEHARDEIASTLEGHFELMAASGETIPPPTHRIEFTFDDDSGEEFCTWVEVEAPVIAGSHSADFWNVVEQRRQEPTIPWSQAHQELEATDN